MDSSSAVVELQSRWHALCDLDRARAVQAIHQAGVSLQDLAVELNCSASLLSHLLHAAEAPVEDRELARLGEISTRELVRRACPSGMSSAHRQREAIAFERECAGIQAARTITRWLDKEKVPIADRNQVIGQACSQFVDSDKSALGPLGAALPDIPLGEVIRLFRPALLGTDEDCTVAWYARWLALWTLHGILDDEIRARSLELARGEGIKRPS